mmetsp:Transcript_24641/g.59309  ORF Transcript_24641/g.59309 Transcript_24641/m.59309 type:complete len:207 (-) Transcript_24641:266-886(-)
MGWKEWFGMEEEEKSFLKEFEDALPSLTYKQRLIGFSVCFGAGWIVSFISAAFLPRIDTAAGAAGFGTFYTLGNLISIFSSCFLWGPCNQLKSMVACHRLFATCLYFVGMGLTVQWKFISFPIVRKLHCKIILPSSETLKLLHQLFAAFYQGDGYTSTDRIGAVIGCMVFQMGAMTWYTLSFIPYARTIIKACVRGVCSKFCPCCK